MSVKNRELS